jgi:hypothetical protein
MSANLVGISLPEKTFSKKRIVRGSVSIRHFVLKGPIYRKDEKGRPSKRL